MSFIMASTIFNTLEKNPSVWEVIGFAPPIERKKKMPFSGHRLFTSRANSKYPNESWEFIEFMLSKGQMLKRRETLNMPVVRKSLEQEYLKTDPELKKSFLNTRSTGRAPRSCPLLPFPTFILLISMALGLGAALLLGDAVPGIRLYRICFYLP